MLSFSFSTYSLESLTELSYQVGHPLAILAEIYIEALLVDEEMADDVWKQWSAGVITDDAAVWAWLILASMGP
jgi:hypothetical protein